MTDWQPVVFSLVVVVLLGTVALILKRRRARLASAALAEANHARWEFTLHRQDELGRLIDDPRLSPDELQRAADEVLARMQTVNDTGDLDPLIADNRAVIREALEKRRRRPDGA